MEHLVLLPADLFVFPRISATAYLIYSCDLSGFERGTAGDASFQNGLLYLGANASGPEIMTLSCAWTFVTGLSGGLKCRPSPVYLVIFAGPQQFKDV